MCLLLPVVNWSHHRPQVFPCSNLSLALPGLKTTQCLFWSIPLWPQGKPQLYVRVHAALWHPALLSAHCQLLPSPSHSPLTSLTQLSVFLTVWCPSTPGILHVLFPLPALLCSYLVIWPTSTPQLRCHFCKPAPIPALQQWPDPHLPPSIYMLQLPVRPWLLSRV